MDELSKLLTEDFKEIDYVMVFTKDDKVVLYDFNNNSTYTNYKVEENKK